MQRTITLLLLVFLTISQGHSKNHWNVLFPAEKEIDYNYEATVSAETNLPEAYASMFHLKGVLHIQRSKEPNTLFMQLTDMNYTLDNGKISDFPEKTTVKLTEELKPLMTPFKIVYNEEGVFQEMGVDINTPDYILNIKKAMVSLFQMDWMKIDITSDKNLSFKSKDVGLHGLEDSIYNIIQTPTNLKIERMHHMSSSEHLFHHVLSSVNTFQCDDVFEDPLTHDSQKTYTIDRPDMVLRKIENTGGIYYHPYLAKSSAYHIFVRQTLEMIEMHEIQTVMTLPQEKKLKDLEFNHNLLNPPMETINNERLVPAALGMFENAVQLFENRKVEATAPDFNNDQILVRLRNVLKQFDIQTFEKLYTQILGVDKKVVTIFYQMLPYVGTQLSTKFIITLIKQNKMPELMTIKVLQEMPFFVTPNEEFLKETEVLLNLEGVSVQVQNVAILSFATILKKTQSSFLNHHDLVSNAVIEKYVTILVEKMKTSNSLDEKYVYLNALYNIGSPLITKQLKDYMPSWPIIDQLGVDNNIRMKAMMSSFSAIRKNPDTLYELYWPILFNRNLSTEMRAMAFYIIMASKPELSTLINMYWLMHTETDVDLYQLYYTYMESFAYTRNTCDRIFRMKAKQVMKYMKVPFRHSLTQYKKIDFVNFKFNSAEYIDYLIIDSNESLVFKLGYGKNIMNMHIKPIEIFIRITGLKGKLLNDLKLNIKKQMKLYNYEKVIHCLLMLPQTEGVHIEFMLAKHGQVVFSDSIHKTNYLTKKQMYIDMFKGYFTDMIHFDFELPYDISIPSDIGFTFKSFALMKTLTKLPMDLKMNCNGDVLTINIDGKMKKSHAYVNGLYVYNPIAQILQGVSKSSTYDVIVPLFLDINYNLHQDMLKITWKRYKNPEDNVWIKRAYSTHIVISYDMMMKGTLKKLNPNTKNHLIIPTNNEDRNNYILKEVEDLNTGYVHHVELIDTENTKSVEETSHILKLYTMDVSNYMEHELKSLQLNNNLLKSLLQMITLEKDLFLMYHDNRRGVFIKMEPSKTNPITSNDLSLRLSHEITNEGQSLILPEMRIMLKATYTMKNEEDLVKRWHLNVTWDLNEQHTQNTIKGQLTRTLPGQTDYKICIEGTENYSETSLKGNMKILMGLAPEGVCSTTEGSIDIKMIGQRLPEQLKYRYNFPSCDGEVLFGIEGMPSYSCMVDKTSLRKYEIEITSKDLPKQLQMKIQSLMEFLKMQYYNKYTKEISNESNTEVTKLFLTYPISNDVLDMEMIKNGIRHKLSALPAANFRRYGLFVPDNLYFGNAKRFAHEMGLVYTCSANINNIMNVNNTMMRNVITEDWTLMIGDSENPATALWAKRIDGKLGLKLVVKTHVLMVMPVGNTFALTLDGENIPNPHLLSKDWLLIMAERNMLTLLLKSCGSQIIYNLNEVVVEVPKFEVQILGKCM